MKQFCCAYNDNPTNKRRKNTIFQTCYDVSDEQCGIAIDMPIMENIPDNIVLRKIHGFGSLVFGFIVSCRRFYKNRKFMLQMSQGIEDVQKVFKTKIALGFFTITQMDKNIG